MKQMKFLPPGMGAGAYSPRRKAIANANYKKLMRIVDQLNKTCRASSCSESMKESSRTNLSKDSDSERKCPLTLSKFDEKKADDGSLSPIIENQDSTFMTKSYVKVSDVVPEDVMKEMSIPQPAMAAGSYPPPRSAISIAEYEKLMCLVHELSKTYNASSLLESKKESSPTYLSAKSDSKRRCPSALSKFDEIKANDGSLSPIVENPDSTFMTKSCVQVSDVVPEEVMKEMLIPLPAMAAGSYPPPRSEISIAEYKKLMCLVDELSKTYNASSLLESKKVSSPTYLNAESDLERKCPSALSKFDEKKADDGSLSPIVESPDSTFMTKSCVQVSDVVPEEVMKDMPIPPPAMAAGSYPPPRSAISIADYKKLMCLVNELSKTYKASSLLESTKESSPAYLRAESDSKRRCPSASSKFDEIKMPIPLPAMAAGSYPPPRSAISIADYKKLMCLVDELSKTFKASSLLESKKDSSPTYLSVESDSEMWCPSASSKFDQIKMSISLPAMAAGSYPPSRSVVSIADNNKLMCLVDQLSKTFKALPWLESTKESSPTYFSADNLEQVQVSDVLSEEVMIQMPISPPAMRKKTVVFLDYVGTISPFVANFLSYANTSYADTSYAMKIVILFIISMIPIIVYLFWLRSTTPPPLQDTTLDTTFGTWPNFFPQDAFADCCPICLSSFDDEQEGEDNTLWILPYCKHVFHARCVDQWLREHPTCPMCRLPVMLG